MIVIASTAVLGHQVVQAADLDCMLHELECASVDGERLVERGLGAGSGHLLGHAQRVLGHEELPLDLCCRVVDGGGRELEPDATDDGLGVGLQGSSRRIRATGASAAKKTQGMCVCVDICHDLSENPWAHGRTSPKP